MHALMHALAAAVANPGVTTTAVEYEAQCEVPGCSRVCVWTSHPYGRTVQTRISGQDVIVAVPAITGTCQCP